MLTLLAAPQWGKAQVDTCYDFSNRTIPSGWTITSSSYYNCSLTNYYLQIGSSSGITYIVLPYTGVDFFEGLAIQFYAINGSNIEVGTMPTMQDTGSFSLVSKCAYWGLGNWHRYIVDLTSANPLHHHICFRIKPSSYYCSLDDIFISHTTGLVGNFRIDNAVCNIIGHNNWWTWNIYSGECYGDTIHLAWDSYNGQPFMLTILDYSINDTVYHNPSQTGNHQDLLMVPGNGYNIQIRDFAGCGNACLMTPTEIASVSNTRVPCDTSPCINTRILFSDKCTPYYGTYNNPYQSIGLSYYGRSRHQILYDATMTDPVVGPQLHVVPPGDDHSVQLGNELTGAEAEAMVYDISVDTADFDMLILKYAAVMQNPNHDITNQPRFRIEMLDAAGTLIEPAACNSYDFVASSDLGWNQTYYGSAVVLWKDWTIVGINLSDYHGQTVRLRLTTYDCKAGAHFGYAYYNLACAKKTIAFSSCSEGDSNTVTAPAGFNYRWHRDDSETTISTEQTTRIPVDGHHYYCELSFIGDTTCSVTMNVLSRLVWPEAEFNYTVTRESCRFRVNFFDRSHHVGDTTTCESVSWDFGNGATSIVRNPTVYYPDTGTYTVALIASIPGGDCSDTAFATLHLTLAFDTIDTAICANQSLLLHGNEYTAAGSYSLRPNCDSVLILRLTLLDTAIIDTMATVCGHLDYRGTTFQTDTLCNFTYINTVGCDSTYWLHLTVNPVHQSTDSIIVCPYQPWRFMENGLTPPCSFDTIFQNTYGCDSLVHVTLTPRPADYRLHPIYMLDSVVWHPADTIILGCAPDTLHLRDTTLQSIAWLWTLTANGDTLASTTSDAFLPLPSYTMNASFQLIAQSSIGGCFDTVGQPVYIFRTPLAAFDWQYTSGPGINPPIENPEVQFTNRSSPADSLRYLWHIPIQPGSTEYDTTSEVSPYYHWGQPGDYMQGDYQVKLTAYWHQWLVLPVDTITHTCNDTTTQIVTITNDYLQFPNLVTPNGDGCNDTWRVVNLIEYGNYPVNELWVFNQWGIEVYHVRDIHEESNFWDPDATSSPDGTYFYRFTARGPYGIVKRNGVIEVLR